jgi:hypothetical protein
LLKGERKVYKRERERKRKRGRERTLKDIEIKSYVGRKA